MKIKGTINSASVGTYYLEWKLWYPERNEGYTLVFRVTISPGAACTVTSYTLTGCDSLPDYAVWGSA